MFNICGDICGVSLNRAAHILYKSDIAQNFPNTTSIFNFHFDLKWSCQQQIHLPPVSMKCRKLFFLCVVFLQASTSAGLPTDEDCVSNRQIFHSSFYYFWIASRWIHLISLIQLILKNYHLCVVLLTLHGKLWCLFTKNNLLCFGKHYP